MQAGDAKEGQCVNIVADCAPGGCVRLDEQAEAGAA